MPRVKQPKRTIDPSAAAGQGRPIVLKRKTAKAKTTATTVRATKMPGRPRKTSAQMATEASQTAHNSTGLAVCYRQLVAHQLPARLCVPGLAQLVAEYYGPEQPPCWSHCVYLLRLRRPGVNQTYLGSTNDFVRRLRQHRGEISGGARSTTMRSCGGQFRWDPLCIVRGFATLGQARSFETRAKHLRFTDAQLGPHKPAHRARQRADGRPVHVRVRRMLAMCSLDRWAKKHPPAYTLPLAFEWYSREELPKAAGDRRYLPDYVFETFAPSCAPSP